MTFCEVKQYSNMDAKARAKVDGIMAKLESTKTRSAWQKGVKTYAIELLSGLAEELNRTHDEFPVNSEALNRKMLNGASGWWQYSEGGCSLIYNSDIAERVCCPSELKRNRNGERDPNPRESWIQVQGRALFQACSMILKMAYPHQPSMFF